MSARRQVRRAVLLVAIATLVPVAVAAETDTAGDQLQPVPAIPVAPASPAERALESLLDAASPLSLADLTVGDLSHALDQLSIARQEHAHIERSARLSWIAPGLGHYINGEPGTAVAYAAADLVAVAVTALGAYYLLPLGVQPRNLNYLQSTIAEIESRWDDVSPAGLIPAAAVVVSGSLLSITIRSFAARSARELADLAIESGWILFEPEPIGGLGR